MMSLLLSVPLSLLREGLRPTGSVRLAKGVIRTDPSGGPDWQLVSVGAFGVVIAALGAAWALRLAWRSQGTTVGRLTSIGPGAATAGVTLIFLWWLGWLGQP